jgi:predicted Zn finger-like uncharacterized protein
MRTRCPECGTIFRVTSEQLRRKAGKVRCGHCQAIFNAFDHWQADTDQPVVDTPVAVAANSPAEDQQAVDEAAITSPVAENEFESMEKVEAWVENSPLEAADEPEDWVPESEESLVPDEPMIILDAEPEPEPEPEPVALVEAEPIPEVETAPLADPEPAPLADEVPHEETLETPEESTLAAREAGLVAARELSEAAGYNRWAAGTLASDGLGGFGGEPTRRAVWPFVLVAVLLFIALVGQLFYYFRADIALQMPSLTALYRLAGVDIPLPRNPALVSIETSDLQSDNARGLFVLQATLKNRAGHAQAWPALELSLTDTNDTVVSRRVMYAAEYLPPGTTSDSFPANGEIAVKLWIEAKEIGASGYRLYIFYP